MMHVLGLSIISVVAIAFRAYVNAPALGGSRGGHTAKFLTCPCPAFVKERKVCFHGLCAESSWQSMPIFCMYKQHMRVS